MKIEDFASKCCVTEVTKEEYNDFLDPQVGLTSAQNFKTDTKNYTFYYNVKKEVVIAVSIKGKGSTKYWLTGY